MLFAPEQDHARAVAVGVGTCYRFADAGGQLLLLADAQAVDNDPHLIGRNVVGDGGQELLDEHRLSLMVYAHQTIGQQLHELFNQPLTLVQAKRSRNFDTCAPLA